MFKNYLKIAWRNIKRNKMHAAIHIVGLAVAFSICILLFLTAYFHLSYDSFHKDESQLFRISRFTNNLQNPEMTSNMPLPIGPALKGEMPEIETAVTISSGRPEKVSYEGKDLDRWIRRTDADFFEVFNFPLAIGNVETALSGIQDIVLSESTAKAIFGDEDPIGKELKIGKEGEEMFYTVSAIAKDPPKNSSIRFDAVARIETVKNYGLNINDWSSNSTNVFVKISTNSNPQIVEEKLIPFVEKYYMDQLAQLKIEHTKASKTHELLSLNLTNINDIHFSGERSSPKMLVYAIMALGAFILLIACFNFVNLNMAHSFKRSRELGVRKTLGAFKGQLFLQLWGEAVMLYFVGFVIGIGIAYRLLPTVSAEFGGGLDISTLFQPEFLMIMLGVFLGVTLIAGGYPALKMSNFRLVEILKGNISTKKPGVMRNSLLVCQFAIASLLICVSVISSQQLDYIRQKPIGFEKEQVVSIPVGNLQDGRKVLARMRNELANDPSVVSIAGAGENLGRGRDRTTTRSEVSFDYNQQQISAYWLLADFGFLKTLQIPLIEGRDFNQDLASDTVNAFVVTESFVKAMGEKDPIGKYFGGDDETSGNRIIGVVSDFNAYSPSEKELPIAVHLSATQPINYIFIKVQSDDPQIAMERLENKWEMVTDEAEFKGSFLDENLQAWYEMESTMVTTFGIASGVAIFLSCLGLFAVSLLVIELRTKEIGIRKVMGASIKAIISMVSWHFLKLVLISLFISMPLAWYAMKIWIENYEYRINISPLTFIWVGVLVAVVALVTVSFHAIKAAMTNPVKSLRTE